MNRALSFMLWIIFIGAPILANAEAGSQAPPSMHWRVRAIAPRPDPPTPNIVGGEEAQPGDWPWMAAITVPIFGDPYLDTICGGTLIHPHWVVTAAHCTYMFEDIPSMIEVIVGIHKLSNNDGQHISVSEIIIPVGFNNQSHANDIALLRLAQPAVLNGMVKAIPLVTPDLVSLTDPGVFATVTGWGYTSSSGLGFPADTLRQVTIPIVSNQTCQQAYQSEGITITDAMLCAGEDGKDACNGDSGGPLVVPDETQNDYRLGGIVSFGPQAGCGLPGTYGGYTRVSAFIDWIESYTGPLEFDFSFFLPFIQR